MMLRIWHVLFFENALCRAESGLEEGLTEEEIRTNIDRGFEDDRKEALDLMIGPFRWLKDEIYGSARHQQGNLRLPAKLQDFCADNIQHSRIFHEFLEDFVRDFLHVVWRSGIPPSGEPDPALWDKLTDGWIIDLGGPTLNDYYRRLFNESLARLLGSSRSEPPPPQFSLIAALGRSSLLWLYQKRRTDCALSG
jgi:hypothetical protein